MFARRLICWWIGALGLATGAFCQTYVSFTNIQDTFAYSINDSGVVAGSTSPNDSLGLSSDWCALQIGTITGFNAPGNVLLSICANSINAPGVITGYYLGLPFTFHNFTNHGYVRDPEGNITTFDPPGSVDTQAFSINAGGAITGYYNESNLVIHGFLREPNGKFTAFNAPDSISTKAVSINAVGAITGITKKPTGASMDSCVTPRDISHRSILRGPRGHSRHQLLRGDHGLLHKSRRAATRVCARRGGEDHVVRRSPDQHQRPRSDRGLWLFAVTRWNDY